MRRKIIFAVQISLLVFILVMIGISVAPRFLLRSYMEVSMPPEQRDALEKGIKFDLEKIEAAKRQVVPDHIIFTVYMNLGRDYHLLGDLKNAEEFYLKAKKVAIHNPIVWSSLFFVYKDMHDYKNAITAVRKSLEINGNDWNLWRARIELERYQFHRSFDELDDLYQEALKATNNDINIITVYAKFLEERGDFSAAIKYWQMAIEKNPENELYSKEIQRLEAF